MEYFRIWLRQTDGLNREEKNGVFNHFFGETHRKFGGMQKIGLYCCA
jgi:hypothetical protein